MSKPFPLLSFIKSFTTATGAIPTYTDVGMAAADAVMPVKEYTVLWDAALAAGRARNKAVGTRPGKYDRSGIEPSRPSWIGPRKTPAAFALWPAYVAIATQPGRADEATRQWTDIAALHPQAAEWAAAEAAHAPVKAKRDAAREAAIVAFDILDKGKRDEAIDSGVAAWRKANPEAALRRDVTRAFATCDYRSPSAKEATDSVEVAVTPRGGKGLTGSVAVATNTGWIDYKSHGWRKGVKGRDVTLTIPADWAKRVPEAVRVVSRMLTLDAIELTALPVGAPEGSKCWSARWVVAGKGLGLQVEDGVILVVAGHSIHGTSPKAALASYWKRTGTGPAVDPAVQAKRAAARAKAKAADRNAARMAAFRTALGPCRADLCGGDVEKALNRAADALRVSREALDAVQVTEADSVAAGNCRSGTLDWVNRHDADATNRSVRRLARIIVKIEDRRDLAVAAIEAALWRAFGKTWKGDAPFGTAPSTSGVASHAAASA